MTLRRPLRFSALPFWEDSLFCDTHKIGGAALAGLSARKRA